jgi:quercetin dioxygenase-like cupin family protein
MSKGVPSMTDADGRAVLPAGEVWLGGFAVIYRLPAAATGGALSVVEGLVKPGTLIPPHTHSREDEYGLVLEGVFGARVGDEYLDAGPGEWLIRPRGIPHAFWNAGPNLARLLEITVPGGFERYFAEVAELAGRGLGPFDTERARLREAYGLVGNGEWVAELEQRFGVHL